MMVFVVGAMMLQAVVLQSEVFESFPSPTIDPETDSEEVDVTVFGFTIFTVVLPNIVAFAVNAFFWPVNMLVWLFELALMVPVSQMFPVGVRWIFFPVQVVVGASILLFVMLVSLRIVDALGQVIPTT